LRAGEPEDMKIIRRLIEKALELSIKKVTGHRKMHGIFLLEEYIPLYRCEKARLYLGFSTRVSVQDSRTTIEWTTQAYVRESVLDYVQLRRESGSCIIVGCCTFWSHPMTWRSSLVMTILPKHPKILKFCIVTYGSDRI
jgi:hypothetical protein